MTDAAPIMAVAAALLIVGVLASRVAGRLGVPALLLFLAIGMLAGLRGLRGHRLRGLRAGSVHRCRRAGIHPLLRRSRHPLSGCSSSRTPRVIPGDDRSVRHRRRGLQDVALALEPGERGVLQRPPRSSSEGVLSRTLWERAALAAIVMATGTLVMFRWELDRTDSVSMAQTVALTTLVVFQVFQAGNSRSESESLFRISPISNPFLFAATLAAVGLHVLALYFPPTQYILRVEPIGIDAWGRIILTASTILIVMEADKFLRRRRRIRAQAR